MRSYRARGTSMLPGVYPRDVLWVRAPLPGELAAGAIVVYPGPQGGVVCHRLVGVDARAEGRWLAVRGDAQRGCEWIHEDAVAGLLVAVDGRLGRWRVNGPRGRLLRWLALAEHPLPMAVRTSAASGLRRAAAVRRALRG